MLPMVDRMLHQHLATQIRFLLTSIHLAACLLIYSIPVNPLPTRERSLILPLPRMHRNSRSGAAALWVLCTCCSSPLIFCCRSDRFLIFPFFPDRHSSVPRGVCVPKERAPLLHPLHSRPVLLHRHAGHAHTPVPGAHGRLCQSCEYLDRRQLQLTAAVLIIRYPTKCCFCLTCALCWVKL